MLRSLILSTVYYSPASILANGSRPLLLSKKPIFPAVALVSSCLSASVSQKPCKSCEMQSTLRLATVVVPITAFSVLIAVLAAASSTMATVLAKFSSVPAMDLQPRFRP